MPTPFLDVTQAQESLKTGCRLPPEETTNRNDAICFSFLVGIFKGFPFFQPCHRLGAGAVPPAPAPTLPDVGTVLAPPSPVAFTAPVVQAVAVSACGGSSAGLLGGAVERGSRPWSFAV